MASHPPRRSTRTANTPHHRPTTRRTGSPWLCAGWLVIAGGCSTTTATVDRSPSPTTLRPVAGQPSRSEAWLEGLLWPDRAPWREWGNANLQSGDLIFVRSDYRMMLGAFDLSRFLAEVGQSPFSHVGLVVVEAGGRPLVYDITDQGIQSQPFATFVTSGSKQRLAVRRPIGRARDAVDAAIQYVRDRQRAGTSFDRRFQPGDDRLYCTELIVEAYRRGGIELAPPIAAGALPGLDQVGATQLRLVRWATGLEADDPVVLPGNDDGGLYGSPWLQTVLDPVELP